MPHLFTDFKKLKDLKTEDKLNSLPPCFEIVFSPFEPQISLPAPSIFLTLNKFFQLSYRLFPENLSSHCQQNFDLEASTFILPPPIYKVCSSSFIGKIMFPLFVCLF